MGASACQIAKNVLGAAKVITTVSTDKVLKVEQLLGPGVVDEGALILNTLVQALFLNNLATVVDYNKSSPVTQIPHRSVDVLLDNSAVGQSYVSLLLDMSLILNSSDIYFASFHCYRARQVQSSISRAGHPGPA